MGFILPTFWVRESSVAEWLHGWMGEGWAKCKWGALDGDGRAGLVVKTH
jgi:hypothetical protein